MSDKATPFSDIEEDGTPRTWSVLITVIDEGQEAHEEQTYYADRGCADVAIADARPLRLGQEEEMTIALLRRVGSYWVQLTREDYTWRDNLENND